MTTPVDDARLSNEQLVQELFARESARDYQGMTALMADDIEFDLAYPPEMLTMPMHGRDAMHELITNLIGGTFESFAVEVTETYQAADPEVIIVEYRSDGIVKHNGNSYRNRYVAVLRIRDSKIVFWREYHNTEEATRALGR